MPPLKNLTPTYWKAYKKRADIANKKWFRSDASVGAAIGRVISARDSYRRAKTEKTLMTYYRALEALGRQMDRFLKTKEFKTEVAQRLYREILAWKVEINDKLLKLARKYKAEQPKLRTANAVDMDKTFDQFIL